MARKYSKKSQASVKTAMHKFKRGKLESGKSGKSVKNRKQAIAIGLSEARAKGEKVPTKSKTARGTKKSTASKKRTAQKASTATGSTGRKKTTSRKSAASKSTAKRTKRARSKRNSFLNWF